MSDRHLDTITPDPQVLQGEDSRENRYQALVQQMAGELCEPCIKQAAAPIHPLLSRLEKALAGYHQHFQQSTLEELVLSYASEWVMDNYYIIRQSIQQIWEDLPQSYLNSLPKVSQPPFTGYPRIYLITRSFLTAEQLQVDLGLLESFFAQLQEQIPLTIGELWAVPIFLRMTLIEALVSALDQLLNTRSSPALDSELALKISPDDVVAAAVTGLRVIANLDWKTFFETVSQVDQILRLDPAGVYPDMDFNTRDLYRKAVEELSIITGQSQKDVALSARAISEEYARQHPDTGRLRLEADRRGEHVGYYLIDKGRPVLEASLGYSPGLLTRVKRWLQSHRLFSYLASIFLFVILLMGFATLYLLQNMTQGWLILTAWAVLLIPAVALGTGLTNWLATQLFAPAVLPKLEIKDEIPQEWHTLVTIPALFTSKEEVQSLVNQLELHYLRNPHPGLFFALASDFADADQETLPEDQELVKLAEEQIDRLNRRYQRPDGTLPFLLFHRRRGWNASEGKWIGWERKRGKLHELNQLLRGTSGLSFSHVVGSLHQLEHVRYILTLDADTILPIGAARRLIGAMAHPLNRPIFAPGSSQVIAGYTILQPRIAISPNSSNRSWFTRIFAGDAGLDLYSLAVSDVYQDLFGEGIYVGKGIYDLDGFERSISNRIPENTLLSHDLFEGLLGRAGLVTDITLVESYPANYFIFARRQHRWIRGDWQLLPWLLSPQGMGVNLSLLDRWKLLDNLRRSLFSPALMLLLLIGWTILPGQPWVWTLIGLLSLAVPVLTNLVTGTIHLISDRSARSFFRPVWLDFLRFLLAVVFLPFEAMMALDAAATALYRMWFSRRKLLQWVTVAHTEMQVSHARRGAYALRAMVGVVLIVFVLAVVIMVNAPRAFWQALPLFIIWLFSPQVAAWINRPFTKKQDILTEVQLQQLRSYARRTWSFFETFVGPEDHWLPPDHYQESPVGVVAHRTSPTNTGLLLTSTLAAYELGYIDLFNLVARLSATFETLESLERYRGHFLNWIDTRTLQPLNPRYVSTVDSGNLAACLIVTAESLRVVMQEMPLFRWQHWQGYVDTLAMFDDTLSGLTSTDAEGSVQVLRRFIEDTRARISSVRDQPEKWYQLFLEVSGPIWEEMTRHLAHLVASEEVTVDFTLLRYIRQTAQQIDQQLKGMQRTIHELVPWIPLLETPPVLLTESPYTDLLNDLRASLPYSPVIGDIAQHITAGRQVAAALREALDAGHPDDERAQEAADWLARLSGDLDRAAGNSGVLLVGSTRLASQALRYVEEMDFRFLYNPQRRVFHIGYNMDAARLDENYYDLLASEARITSLIAIAKNDVPQEHWLHLNRPVTLVDGRHVLLSWSATMFEYLMPPMFFESIEGTLLDKSVDGAVLRQVEYGRRKDVPWGISESGFYRFDANQNYQYRAFGVPGLGFKRGLADDLVIAPYASFMAVGYQPLAVLRNAEQLAEYGMLGLHGFYEAIDFTENRLPYGKKYALVRSYMAHHHGMTLLALVNYLSDNIIVRRMHSHTWINTVELLLQEHVPYAAPLQYPESEDSAGIQRLQPPPVEIQPWEVPVRTTIPQVHVLSNGSFTSLISNSGSGFIRWQDTDLTRWQADGVLDQAGIWIYLKDLDSGDTAGTVWSVTNQPIPETSPDPLVTFYSHMVAYKLSVNGVTSTLEVTVPVEDPVEIRRLNLSNPTDRARRVSLTSYGEVILTNQANDSRHPAFNKLFIQSEYLPELDLLIFRRRARSSKEAPIYMAHMLVTQQGSQAETTFETDRAKFLGRWNSVQRPEALYSAEQGFGSSGATLDPIFSLGREVEIQPHESVQLAWLSFAGRSREEILALAKSYRSWNYIERAYYQTQLASENRLRKQEIGADLLNQFLQILSALLYPHPLLRTDPATIASNRLGQSGLWPFGISGDYPILLVTVKQNKDLDLPREALLAHRFFRDRGVRVDLVILNEQQTDYGAEMNRLLYRLITRTNSENWLHQRGGIFVLYADQMKPAERILLQTAARVILRGERGSLQDHLPGFTVPVEHLPAFTSSRGNAAKEEALPLRPEPEDRLFYNGYGGFTPDGREYVIDVAPGKNPPLPWSNVIGYPEFGFLVTESGSSSTWAVNSGENRLTPWWNDPISDPTGEVLYLRDEETGEVWTPTPQPAGGESHFRVFHGAGYTRFEHHSHELQQHLSLFADPYAPLKVIRLRVKNTSDRPRRITATQYVEWVLGTLRSTTSQYLIPEYVPLSETLLVSNPYSMEFSQRVAFLAASKKIHGMTADRLEFIGRSGSLRSPIALKRIGLEGRVTPGDHPCAVLQLHLDLAPGGEEEICFFLGQGADRQQALALVDEFHGEGAVANSWQRVIDFWNAKLEAVQVETPDKALDLLLNRWFLYQALSCRIWGRTAFYQSSGAFGFRDQLQDVMSVLAIAPEIAREQILNAARHQFEEGDVLHWWHPPTGRGVRTRISDDLLWLPYVVAEYVRATGDTAILQEEEPFRSGPLLGEEEEERYAEFPLTEHAASILEHCRRAVDKGSTRGPHQLPLIGTGDWNDGMNRVGVEGHGESVWLAWFLYEALERFSWLCEISGQEEQALRYRQQAQEVIKAVERSAWDGRWYLRAFYDNGSPLGSRRNRECYIDSIAQSWSVISGAGDPERARQAMESVLEHLIRPDDRLLLLFTPPFNQTLQDPGYIKGYVPGIRENGGQYTHAATWTVWAFAMLGQGSRAGELYRLLNPIYHSETQPAADVYKVEPYVIAADVYSVEPHVRRGGWTWYTGSSGWMYRLGLEALLGFKREGEHLVINPSIPAEWEQFQVTYHWQGASYHIHVRNPQHVEHGVRSITVDGVEQANRLIPLLDDQQAHHIDVEMG